jgi:phosphatidylinositol glycan class B
LSLLLAFRIVNALTLHTFFQPDEYFQSLEPAWQLAFGQTSNAWITWVNRPSALHSHLIRPLACELGLTIHAGVEKPIAVVPAS